MDDVNILKKFLIKIFNSNNPLIVVSSGSSGKEIIPICKQESNIKEVIIFCMDYENNKHYIDEYPGYVKKVIMPTRSSLSIQRIRNSNEWANTRMPTYHSR